jgi:DNA repair protein RecO (recombination protein O)
MASSIRQRLYRTEAIILRRQVFGEADRLLTLYTPGLGKIRVLAKGVRKPTSRKAGHVELFTHATLLIAKGKSLDIVTQADTIDAFMPLRNDLARASCAYYLAELVDKSTEEGEENRRLFDLLLRGLFWLCEDEDTDLILRYFDLGLLDYVGYRPQLFRCVRCGQDLGKGKVSFAPWEGGVLCAGCAQGERNQRRVSAQALAVVRHLQTRDYDQCRRLKIDQYTHRELEGLLRSYLVYLLEHRLRSADFLDALRRQQVKPRPEAMTDKQ